jgi:hypothetical protein
VKNREFEVNVKDDATFVDALANVDKKLMNNPEESPFNAQGYLRCYLQIFWDPENNKIYDDIHHFAVGNRGTIMPIRRNIEFNLHNDGEIALSAVMCD